MSPRIRHDLAERTRRWRTLAVAFGIAGIVLVSIPRVRADFAFALDIVLCSCLAFFALEWILTIRSAVTSGRALNRLLSLEHAVDALAVAPIVVAFAAGFTTHSVWLLGALWLLKLEPALASVTLLARVIALEARSLVSVVILFFITLLFAAIALYLAERHAQPENFGTLLDSLYWAITTLTTTGYGDLVPITGLGRLAAGLVMICGIAVFGLWIGILATGFAQESRRLDFMRTWELVANSSFFRSLSPPEIIEVANMLKRWDVPAGTVVVREGREGDCMYFIASGQAEVRLKGRSYELRPPAFFGELALLGSGMRTATVVTTSPTVLLVLDRANFRLFLARHPELAKVIEREAKQRATQNLARAPADEKV